MVGGGVHPDITFTPSTYLRLTRFLLLFFWFFYFWSHHERLDVTWGRCCQSKPFSAFFGWSFIYTFADSALKVLHWANETLIQPEFHTSPQVGLSEEKPGVATYRSFAGLPRDSSQRVSVTSCSRCVYFYFFRPPWSCKLHRTSFTSVCWLTILPWESRLRTDMVSFFWKFTRLFTPSLHLTSCLARSAPCRLTRRPLKIDSAHVVRRAKCADFILGASMFKMRRVRFLVAKGEMVSLHVLLKNLKISFFHSAEGRRCSVRFCWAAASSRQHVGEFIFREFYLLTVHTNLQCAA